MLVKINKLGAMCVGFALGIALHEFGAPFWVMLPIGIVGTILLNIGGEDTR